MKKYQICYHIILKLNNFKDILKYQDEYFGINRNFDHDL